jgi:DNA-binding MarR family transcriptional regulator
MRNVRTEDASAPVGPAQLSALSVLVFAGPGPQTLGALARAEGVRAPTMSRIVASLERGGLATAEADVSDARVLRITATSEGRRLVLEGRDRRERALAELLRGATASERECLGEAADVLLRLLATAHVPAVAQRAKRRPL